MRKIWLEFKRDGHMLSAFEYYGLHDASPYTHTHRVFLIDSAVGAMSSSEHHKLLLGRNAQMLHTIWMYLIRILQGLCLQWHYVVMPKQFSPPFRKRL